MKKMVAALAACAAFGLPIMSAQATIQAITAVPTNWQVRWYPGGVGTLVSGTGSTCAASFGIANHVIGVLNFTDGTTVEDMKVFYNAVVLAKTTASTILLQYGDQNA